MSPQSDKSLKRLKLGSKTSENEKMVQLCAISKAPLRETSERIILVTELTLEGEDYFNRWT